MKAIWFVALAGILFGCSQDPLKTAREQQHENADHWKLREDKMAGYPDTVVLVLKATNQFDTPDGPTTPGIVVGCGGFGSNAVVSLGKRSIDSSDVKISFDDGAPLTQKWHDVGTERHALSVPEDLQDDFLSRLTKAKTFEIELTPKGGKPQRATFKVRNLKELMSLESSCKSWLAAAHVDAS